MDIKDNATYPYPIWGLHEDFNGPEPEGSFEMKLNETANEFILNYNVITNNEGINQLITEGKAVYKCGKPYRFFTVRSSSCTSLSKDESVASFFSTVSMDLMIVV